MATDKKPAKGSRRHNGEGTISGPRKDGRYVGAFYAPTTAGTYKRVYVYGKTWEQARDRLVEEQSKVVRGIPVADESWRLGPYLDYWLENVVKPTRRAATYALYETYHPALPQAGPRPPPAAAAVSCHRPGDSSTPSWLKASPSATCNDAAGSQRCSHSRFSRGTHQPQRRPAGRTAGLGTWRGTAVVSRRGDGLPARRQVRPALPRVRPAAALRDAPR